MRMKTTWHRGDKPRSPEETAGALAMIVWGIAVRRARNFQEIGAWVDEYRVLDIAREFLAFLVHVSDRLIHDIVSEGDRGRFITALVVKTGAAVADNHTEIAGPGDYAAGFISMFNRRSAVYADLPFGGSCPSYSMYCCLGGHIAAVLETENEAALASYVTARLIEIEAPEAVATLAKAIGRFYPSMVSAQSADVALDRARPGATERQEAANSAATNAAADPMRRNDVE